jgi:small-conductance mechanosensitive channel
MTSQKINIHNKSSKRILLFLIGCMGTQLLLALLSKNVSDDILYKMGIIALFFAITSIYMFFNDERKTGTKVISGATVWWHSLRPVHAILYFLFAYYAINKKKNAWKILLINTLISFFAWYLHYYQSMEF